MALYIDDKKASIDDVCKVLGINKREIPFHIKSKNFDLLQGVKRDPQSKKNIIPRGTGILASFDYTLKNGESLKITYAETARQELRGGVSRTKYAPRHLMINGLTLSLKDNEDVKFFYLFIHPWNGSSPLNLGKQNPRIVYDFRDTEKKAKADEIKQDELIDALIRLRDLGDTEVRQIAKGYKMDGIDDISTAEVRALLRAKATEKPAQFVVDLDNNEIALIGIVKDAIDKRIITSTTEGLGKVWVLDDRQILTTKSGSDEISLLVAEIESDLETYFPLISNGISNVEREKKLKKPENSRFFDAFKGKSDTIDIQDRKDFNEAKSADAEIEKLRSYYTMNPNDPGLHQGVKRAIIRHGEKILAQFAKDKEAGLIPQDHPDPIVTLEQVQN